MSFKNRYCCIYISNNNNLYFEINILNKNINDIISQINNELNIDFKIKDYEIDDKYGILFRDFNDILFICHNSNLKNHLNLNNHLNNKTNTEQILDLYNLFISKKYN